MSGRPNPRILFIVDFRSEIARGWISYLAGQGTAVGVVSTFPSVLANQPPIWVTTVDLGFSRLVGLRSEAGAAPRGVARRLAARGISSVAVRRLWHATNSSFIVLDTRRHSRTIQAVVEDFRPDIIHAMRIPYEGVLASSLRTQIPLIVSTWGNDLTLWASRRRRMATVTRKVLARADALHCDCERDRVLAYRRGFSRSRPSIVLPGGGGVDRTQFHPGPPDSAVLDRLGIPSDRPVVVNPRGIREYVRNETFLDAWSLVLQSHPSAFAVCVGMAGNMQITRASRAPGIAGSIRLLPHLSSDDLAEVFRAAQLSVSPSVHDGTPNTLLEAMASGCLPVAGDLESIREWITDGHNGLLFDSNDPKSIADAVTEGLANEPLRRSSAATNLEIVQRRADRPLVMDVAKQFYEDVASTGPGIPGVG